MPKRAAKCDRATKGAPAAHGTTSTRSSSSPPPPLVRPTHATEDSHLEIRLRVPKDCACLLLQDVMSEWSEARYGTRWDSRIDLALDAIVASRGDDSVVRDHGDIVETVIGALHRHCGGWWSARHVGDSAPLGFHCDVRFYPMDAWRALPPPNRRGGALPCKEG